MRRCATGSIIPYTFYDAFNAGARKLYWQQINTALFSKGVDAWWEDATEPDLTASPPTLEGQRTQHDAQRDGHGLGRDERLRADEQHGNV